MADMTGYTFYRQYVFSNSEGAYSRGYKDGIKTGESDGRKSKSYDPEPRISITMPALVTMQRLTGAVSQAVIVPALGRRESGNSSIPPCLRSNEENALMKVTAFLICGEIKKPTTPKALNNLARRNTPGWSVNINPIAESIPTLKGLNRSACYGTLSG